MRQRVGLARAAATLTAARCCEQSSSSQKVRSETFRNRQWFALGLPVLCPALSCPAPASGVTHNAYPVLDDSRRRSLFFNWVPAIDRDNLPHMRMSIYPDHVLERLADEADQLTAPGYI